MASGLAALIGQIVRRRRRRRGIAIMCDSCIPNLIIDLCKVQEESLEKGSRLADWPTISIFHMRGDC